MQRSPQQPGNTGHNPGGTTGYSDPSNQTNKTVYFYKDGDTNFPGIRLSVNSRKTRNMDALLNELNSKIPNMSFGVRSVFTPGGHDSIHSVDDLAHDGKYVCSTHLNRAKGVNLQHVRGSRSWHQAGRPSSGKRSYYASLRQIESERIYRPRAAPPVSKKRLSPRPPPPQAKHKPPRKITVMRNGEPGDKHVILLNTRTAQTFDQVMNDLSFTFKMPARRLYTLDGKPVSGLSGIFNGPDTFVLAGKDKFKPMYGMVPYAMQQKRSPRSSQDGRLSTSDGTVAGRLKDKRERANKTRGKWKVWVTTNELPASGTGSNVTLTVYGKKGNSGPLPLGGADLGSFAAGNVDHFEGKLLYFNKVSIGNIGEIYKIRVAHDNKGEFPGWFLDEVKLRDMHTEEELIFTCRRWLSRDEDDSEICRELPAVREGEPVLPIHKYEVTVHTGDVWNGGTMANVYITIYGERGDTGVRQLFNPKRKPKFDKAQVEIFKKNQVDKFNIEAVSLGRLKKIIVGHDATDEGDGWFLDRVVVKESPRAYTDYTFPCSKWLDAGEDDNKIVREIKVQEEFQQDLVEQQLWELEKWKFESDRHVMLFSKSTERALRVRADGTVDGEGDLSDHEGVLRVVTRRGMVRVFNSVANPRFWIAIDNAKLGTQGRGSAYCDFRIRVQQDRSILLESVKYPLQQMTILPTGQAGDCRSNTTSPTVNRQFYAYCKGMFRAEGILMFCTSLYQTLVVDHEDNLYATGKRNRTAHFKVHKVSEGNIRMFESLVSPNKFLRMKDGQCDCQGSGDESCQFKVERYKEKGYVTLESISNRGLFVGMTPDGSVRPTVDTGANNVRLYPEVLHFGFSKNAPSPALESVPEPALVATPPPTKKTLRSKTKTPASREKPPPSRKQKKKVEKKESTKVVEVEKEEVAQEEDVKEEVKEERKVDSAASKSSVASLFEEGDWKVWIHSEETAQNAHIVMVVYGDKANSGPIILGTAGEAKLFLKANNDHFKVNLKSVGEIYKMRIELQHATTVTAPSDMSWKVKEVKLQDYTTKELLKFKLNRWLCMQEDDGALMRELPAIRPKQPVLPVLRYEIEVHTGTEPGSDTDANVYLQLSGERGDTGKRLLHRSDKEQKFLEGQVDTFYVEAVSLGMLTECTISHDGEGPGEGWFCLKVVVREHQGDDKQYVFMCNSWLDAGIDDKKTERTLTLFDIDAYDNELNVVAQRLAEEILQDVLDSDSGEVEVLEKDEPKDGDWHMLVTTGKQSSTMTTIDDVILVVYGTKQQSAPITLGSGKANLFLPGTTEEFNINIGTDLGDIYKVRFGLKNATPESGWFLERVKVKDLFRKELFNFKVNRWFAYEQDDCDIWRELPVVRPGKRPYPVLKYTVEVYTGTEPGADTESNIYVNIHGTRGDTGSRRLYRTLNNSIAFQEGQMDQFTIEAVHLDEVNKLVVGHDGEESGAGWFLEKVIVREPEEFGKEYYFPCSRWLDCGQDDGLIERELVVTAPPASSVGHYKVIIKTHTDSLEAPTNAKVDFVAYGEKGVSQEITLEGEEKFTPGSENEFEVHLGDIGDLYKVRVSQEDNNDWDGWYLECLTLVDMDTQEEKRVNFDRWMARDRDDWDVVREMPVAKDNKELLPTQCYDVHVHTGDHWAAETDAEVYITIYGSKGDTGKRKLIKSNQSEKFLRNQVDTFTIEGVTVQELSAVVVGHNGVGHGAGWFLEKIEIETREGETSDVMYTFPCGRWLDDHEDDHVTERKLRPLGTLNKTIEQPRPKSDAKTQGAWKVVVHTSDLHNAGTLAKVHLTVFGDKGVSGPTQLTTGNEEDFSQGASTSFNINLGDIGDLFKIRLEHDNSNAFPAWHVDKVIMEDEDTGEELVCYIDRWLAVDEDDHSLCRESAAATTRMQTLPVLHYVVCIQTGKLPKASTDANVYINIIGENGDTGKRHLLSSLTSETKWQQGQADVFIVEAVALGKIDNVILSHDGSKKDQSWFVDHVSIRESEYALTETVFDFGGWLEAGSEGAEVSLLLSGDEVAIPLPPYLDENYNPTGPSSGRWIIWVICASENLPGTTASLSMVVYGTHGNSTHIQLSNTDETLQNFEPLSSQAFDVDIEDIGKFYKIRLCLSPQTQNESVHIKKLKMKDIETGEEYLFLYNDWLSKTETNPDACVELPVVRPDLQPLKETVYVVSTTTGAAPRADTEATVYCKIYGDWGDTGSRLLATSTNNTQKFQQGQTDIFRISAVDIGDVRKVLIGHSSEGRGQGWLCQQVTVIAKEMSDREVVFPCHRWLDTGCDDRKLERELLPLTDVPVFDVEEKQTIESKGEWKCYVNMYNKSPEGTLSPVQLYAVMYGDKGKTDMLELKKEETEAGEEGHMDEYQLKFEVGQLYKMRVHYSQENTPDSIWPVQDILLEDTSTKDQYKFDFGGFIDEGYTQDSLELPVTISGKVPARVVNYIMTVYTGEVERNGTGCQVNVCLHGNLGDTGSRSLKLNQDGEEPFQSYQVDTFEVKAVDLGDIEKISIEKIGNTMWFLKQITIKAGPYAPVEYIFTYDNWLGHNEDGDVMELELTHTDETLGDVAEKDVEGIKKTEGSWEVWTTTAATEGEQDSFQGDAQVVVVFCGDKGDTQPVPLTPSDEDKIFQPEQTDKFKIAIDDVGEIFKVRLGLTGTNEMAAWFVEEVRFQDEHTRDTFHYELNTWVRLDDAHDGLLEFPIIWPAVKTFQVINYCVEVYTGNETEASTEANIYMTLYGKHGNTGKRILKQSSNNDKPFSIGQMDIFEVQAVDLQDIDRVVIGHDGTGEGCGWFCEKVIIKESPDAEKQYYFGCNRWLDASKDDAAIERELVISELPTQEDPKTPVKDEQNIWNVSIINSDGEKAKMEDDWSGNIVMVIYGKNGRSDEIVIGSIHDRIINEQEDAFETEIKDDLGEVYKIRLGFSHDTTGTPSWQPQMITLTEQKSNAEYKFPVTRPVALTTHVDGWVEFASLDKEDELQNVAYEVVVFTGDEENADTEANVSLEIIGEQGDTGKRKLITSTSENQEKFRKGQEDTFRLDAIDLLTVNKVVVGHDNQDGGQGWFLDKILIRRLSSEGIPEVQYICQCTRWLDKDQDDGAIERELLAEMYKPPEPTEDRWNIHLTNGKGDDVTELLKDQWSGKVVMVMYGANGQSEPITLGEINEDKFNDEAENEFEVASEPRDLGTLYKIRLGYSDDATSLPLWRPIKIKLDHIESKAEYVFEMTKQVAITTEQDGWLEVPANVNDESSAKDILPVHHYQVITYTDDRFGAGTDANVYIELHGGRGNTGKRKLHRSLLDGENTFESGNVDFFTIEAVDLNELTSVTIGHDGQGVGPGWYLDKVVVKESSEAEQQYIFQCGRWLDESEDDGAIERELPLTKVEGQEKEGDDWKVWIVNGNHDNAPASHDDWTGRVVMVAYGEQEKSEEITLGPIGVASQGRFLDEQESKFQVVLKAGLGDVYKLRLGYSEDTCYNGDSSDTATLSWKPKTMMLQNLLSGKKFMFHIDAAVAITKDTDGWLEIPTKADHSGLVQEYQVEVYTGDKLGAGTDANVYLEIYGKRGDTGRRKLKKSLNNYNKFESGKMDVFAVTAVDLLELDYVVVGHDGKGAGSGWFLDKIIIKDSPESDEKFEFECNQWLDEGEGDGRLERELDVKINEPPPTEKTWTVTTTTGNDPKDEATAQVAIVIYGDKDSSKSLPLGENKKNKFKAGTTNDFRVDIDEELGDIYKVRVGYSEDKHASWFLDTMKIAHVESGKSYEFELNDRLVKNDDDDGWREIPVKQDNQLQVNEYQVMVYTGNKENAGTKANVYMKVVGERGDTGNRQLLKSLTYGGDKLQADHMDLFVVEAVDLGVIRQVVVGHDVQESGAGWHLDKVVIKESQQSDKEYVFECSNWLDIGEDDGSIERTLEISTATSMSVP
ncbi:unnamed protein product [Owenia fusiformis]|uniref:Uncharacterized protein n=1 Tax=Owenia fusiformis TaxID=6347 RepID=A0A8J1TQ04_OWEFU|nr:unnamed protein product [Owenia fusiformis]